jgi:general secretion pathway protein G
MMRAPLPCIVGAGRAFRAFRGARVGRRAAAGFTLIELLVTLAILGVLASMTVPVAQVIRQHEREQALRDALRQIRDAIDAYKVASKDGRVPVESGASGYPPKLNMLADGVKDQSDPKGGRIYFLRRVPRDPMGEAEWGLRSYKSPPSAPQEGDDVFDVYSRSSDTGLNGVPYKDW